MLVVLLVHSDSYPLSQSISCCHYCYNSIVSAVAANFWLSKISTHFAVIFYFFFLLAFFPPHRFGVSCSFQFVKKKTDHERVYPCAGNQTHSAVSGER